MDRLNVQCISAGGNENRRLIQKRYKLDYDGHLRFTFNFLVAISRFLDRPPLFRPAAERSTSEGYNKLLHLKQRRCTVICKNDKTVQNFQENLENTSSIHRVSYGKTAFRSMNTNRKTFSVALTARTHLAAQWSISAAAFIHDGYRYLSC